MHIWICMPAILIIASIYFPPAWKTGGHVTRGGKKKLRGWSRALSRERDWWLDCGAHDGDDESKH